MPKQKIKWFWESEILSALNDFEKHECPNASYELYDIKELSTRTETLGLGKRLDPTIKKYEAILMCNKCYETFKVIYEYGHNEKADHFEVIEIKTERYNGDY